MVQVKAINTRKVHKVDGSTIFNIVQKMTGESDAEINRVITPNLIPMIGRNDADKSTPWHRTSTRRTSWDSHQQVSWGNALKHLREWTKKAQNFKVIENMVNPSARYVAPGSTPPTVRAAPQIFTDWKKKNAPPPKSQKDKEVFFKEQMAQAFRRNANWNQRQSVISNYMSMPYKKVEAEFKKTSFQEYRLRRKSAQQKMDYLEDAWKSAVASDNKTYYAQRWKTSPEAWSQEMLLWVGDTNPQYYMSWIIANTYHQTNPEVKNISSYEARYKYRNWELKERYYPAIGPGDTLPKTTAGWPRYKSNPKILTIFTLPEVAKELKNAFKGKKDKIENAQKVARQTHIQKETDRKRDLLHPKNIQRSISNIIVKGLDSFNEQKFNDSYAYYEDSHSYSNRKWENLDLKDRVRIEWADIKSSMGKKDFEDAIDTYQSQAQQKYDRIVKDAKAELDRAKSQVTAAKKAAK